jgi:hypothetical protein
MDFFGNRLLLRPCHVIDEIRHPQKMWIMNIVWPVTALCLNVFGISQAMKPATINACAIAAISPWHLSSRSL